MLGTTLSLQQTSDKVGYNEQQFKKLQYDNIKLMNTTKIITFGSFMHGVGRSYTAFHLRKWLENRGFSVYQTSTGDLFREIAQRDYKMTIDDFSEYLSKNEELSIQLDISIDKEMKNHINTLRKLGKYNYILVDGNIVPYYVNPKYSFNILIKADVNIVAKRVFNNPRKGDRPYESEKDAKYYILKRTQKDLIRYKTIMDYMKNNKKYYIEWLYNAYYSFYNRITKPFNLIVYNNKDINETLSVIIHSLRDYGFIV